ncbi:MFS transporter [Massilia sp. MB5]|uniref:MFS transporter n=1 Tax=Massilia sp. MB5 TaxID=2919578 RepID=UPI001F0ED1B1|nr:MFS transporter [Massilia sp. MB5]UMR29753.1 MFS transporter [Massilia sp. MB5]
MLSSLNSIPRGPLLLIVARFASALGSALTGFGLNVWVFRETGSYAIFAALAVAAALPALLFAPVAGVLVDRFARKRLLIVCELLAAATVGGVAAASAAGLLNPYLVGAASVSLALLSTLSWPATMAAVAELTPPAQRAAVNGLAEALGGGVQILNPVLGAALFTLVGIAGIALLDLFSYAVCALLIAAIAFPARTPQAPVSGGSALVRFWREAVAGFQWVAGRRDLAALLLFFAIINIGCSIFAVTLTPYLLSFTSAETLGWCMGLSGAGIVAGGSLFSLTGGLKRHEHGVLLGGLLAGACMLLFGVLRTPAALLACSFCYGLATPLMNASSQTIWQAEVPPAIQGRVFAIRKMIAWGLNPLAILLSVPLAAGLFQPMLGQGLPVRLWGDGAAGPLGMMTSACGLLCLLWSLTVLLLGKLKIEQRIPDPV